MVETVYPRPRGCKVSLDEIVQSREVVFRIEPPRDARLVGYHEDGDSGLIEAPDRRHTSGNPLPILDSMEVMLLDVQGAVTVEEHGWAQGGISHRRHCTASARTRIAVHCMRATISRASTDDTASTRLRALKAAPRHTIPSQSDEMSTTSR